MGRLLVRNRDLERDGAVVKLTIISGGQTGSDRGAHDAAIELGLDRGGWAPAGFAAEDGRIPEIYASTMREAKDTGEHGRNLALRTRLNVQDSDATLLVTFAEQLTGGTRLTANVAKQQRKNCQCLVLPSRGRSRIPDGVKDALLEWIRVKHIEVLNVAGPRESKEPGIQAATRDALVWIFEDVVAEDLREGARVMAAIGAVVDADAPQQSPPAPAPLAFDRQLEGNRADLGPPEGLDELQRAQLDASIREAERDIRTTEGDQTP